MRRWIRAAAVGVALLSARTAQAQTYNFLVDYFGGGNAAQAAGSDNIIGTNILPGDSFFWRIAANGGQWSINGPVSQFPFMAFQVNETANRVGDYTLNLFLGNSTVFTETASNVPHSFVHLGTNTVSLTGPMAWDRMELTFSLSSSIEDPQYAADPNNLQNTNSTISSLLPIFGAPENNSFYPGVTYSARVVPEPATFVLMGLGLGIVGIVARRRRA
ncbi:MAG: PEP-CTERM sorting domain-containing protein [Gemmatimonadetes bacterium]|nr:PEP-CTERM sorting domain-containing protein [Gemmatimonadota bacterium]